MVDSSSLAHTTHGGSVPAKRLIVATPQYSPRDWRELRRTASWVEAHNAHDRIVFYSSSLKALNSAFRSIKQDWPLAIKVAALSRRMRECHAILAHREATGLPLALLKRIGIIRSDLLIYNHAPLSDGPLGVKRILTRVGKWDKMICLSEQEAAEFRVKYGVYSSRVCANPTPVDVETYAPDWSDPDDMSQYVFSCGVSHRDYKTLIGALELSKDVTCIVDPTSPSDKLRNHQSQSLWRHKPDNVIIGYYPDEQRIIQVIRRASFVVVAIAPHSRQLSAGCTLAELAAALGKAVVAASPGLRDYVQHEETGLLVRPGDPHELARAIRRLWEKPAEAIEFGRRGRALMESMYSPEAWVARFREIAGVA